MHSRYFVKPYEFQPADRRTLWARLARPLFARHVRRSVGIELGAIRGLEHLQASLDRGAGIMLASNHPTAMDPLALGLLSARTRCYFHYLASFHLFQQTPLKAWRLRSFGAMSVLRDTPDHQALRACIQVLAEGRRPLVLFPEGTYYRQNDRLGSLLDGTSLICRRAAQASERPIVIHPVAIKFWFTGDPQPAIHERIARLERDFRVAPQAGDSLLTRILRLNEAAIELLERAYLGHSQPGTLSQRLEGLADTLIARVEARDADPARAANKPRGSLMDRIRRLRRTRVQRIAQVADRKFEHPALCAELDVLYQAELLHGELPEYLLENPTIERLGEALQRFEEDWLDMDRPLAPTTAVVEFGPPLDARQLCGGAGERDRMTSVLTQAMRETLARAVDGGRPALARPAEMREFEPVGRTLSIEQSLERMRETAAAFRGWEPAASSPPAASDTLGANAVPSA